MPAHVVRVAPGSLTGLRAVELRWVRVPLVEPFVASHGVEHDREVVLVEAAGADGVSGWGECVALSQPTYTDEHTAGAWDALRELVPAVLRGEPVEVAAAPMAWTAVETALLDRTLRADGVALVAHLGGERASVPSAAVVGMRPTIDALLEAVGARVDAGHALVKLKIEPVGAAEAVRAVRSVWPDLVLAADANGSFAGRPEALEPLLDLGLAYVEQPLAAADLAGHASLRRRGLRVALDESITTPEDLEGAVAAGAVDIVNLKPGRVGGIAASSRVLSVAREAGVDAFVGGMLETGVGRALGLAFAALDACTWPTDLGPSGRYFADDVTAPIVLGPDGRLPVPHGAGLGVTPRPDRLAEVTVRHETWPART